MRTKKFDGSDLRVVLTGMIMDKFVCARISSRWVSEGLFDMSWANLVGGLIVNHFKRYGVCPNGQITSIFENWARETTADEKTVSAVESFLQVLSDSSSSVQEPSDYVIDVAGRYFSRVRIEREILAAQSELERGLVEEAQVRLTGSRKVNLGVGSYVDLAADSEPWIRSFEKERIKPLVVYPGDLGIFFGDAFARGTLYAFMAPDKTGKTWWLVDLMYRASRQRNRVAYFDVGDGNKEEVIARLACRTTQKPQYSGVCSRVEGWNEDDTPRISQTHLEAVDPIEGYRDFKKICKSEDSCRLACYPSSSVSALDIDSILEEWQGDGWRPDVVIIDYADILAPPKGVRDPLDQIDETWKRLRRLSQARHCLVVTATQSSSAAYKKESYLLGKSDFSGRKTKLAHVNGMLGINVSPKEKDVGLARLNWIVKRTGRHNEKSYVRVLGNLAIGCPVLLSRR